METPDRQPDASEASASPHIFVAEVLVSAGPRKSVAEYREDATNAELCEDCGGLCWVGDHLLFWVCDGGSNARILPRLPAWEDREAPSVAGFSARILAQDLGQAFVKQLSGALARGKAVHVVNFSEDIFAPIANAWEERLYRYMAACVERDIPLIETLPRRYKGDLVLRRLDWTSTFTGGVFVPTKRHMMVINYGASGGLIIAKSPAIIEPNNDYLGVVASIQPDEPLHVKLGMSVNDQRRWTEYVDVAGFAIVSDGLKRDGNLTERLQELQETATSLQDVREALLKEVYPVEDDKAVVLGHFL